MGIYKVNAIMHLLEGPSHSVLRILNNLSNSDHFYSDQPIQHGSIVLDVEDRPKRYFPEWYSCIIQEQKSPEELNSENSEELVFDMASKLFELGNKLQAEVQEELELSR